MSPHQFVLMCAGRDISAPWSLGAFPSHHEAVRNLRQYAEDSYCTIEDEACDGTRSPFFWIERRPTPQPTYRLMQEGRPTSCSQDPIVLAEGSIEEVHAAFSALSPCCSHLPDAGTSAQARSPHYWIEKVNQYNSRRPC